MFIYWYTLKTKLLDIVLRILMKGYCVWHVKSLTKSRFRSSIQMKNQADNIELYVKRVVLTNNTQSVLLEYTSRESYLY